VFRTGRLAAWALLAANLLVLILTGARAPLVLALAVIGLSLAIVRGSVFPRRTRVLLLLAALTAAPVLSAAVSGVLPFAASDLRVIQLLETDAGNLSGREILWPRFEQAAAASWWVGWGVGAGNAVIPADSPVSRILHTWAAHNEYLRIAVEGGQVGRALLICLFVFWVRQHTTRLADPERTIMRLVFVAFAVHAVTDNLLISTPACVLFAVTAAVFAEAGYPRVSTAITPIPPSQKRLLMGAGATS
jgi:O-antigen ligase